MRNMNWIHVRSKKVVAVRHAVITAELISVIFSKRKKCLECVSVFCNLYFYNHMMEEIRDALDEGRFADYKKMRLEGFAAGEQK